MSLDTTPRAADTGLPGALLPTVVGARFPRHQDLAAWLHADGRAAGGVCALLPLVEGLWMPAERLALHRALWQAWSAADGAQRQAARRLHDGRYARWCGWMDLPWAAPLTTQRLARAHLRDIETVPELALKVPADPAYVRHLLHAVGADEAAPPWHALAVVARLADGHDPLDAPACRVQARGVRAALAQGGVRRDEALALLFGLAVQAGDESAALDVLVQGLSGPRPVRWPAGAFRRWLEGAAGPAGAEALPLQLAAEFQSRWLQLARLGDPAWRATLAASLRRPALHARLQALDAALPPALRASPAAAASANRTDTVDARAAWLRLKALDGAYALAQAGGLTLATTLPLLARGTLAAPAVAALARLLALQQLDQGRLQSACAALAWARAAGCPQARGWLAALLATLAPAATAGLVAVLRGGSPGGPDGDEYRAWQALAGGFGASAAPGTNPTVVTIARGMLARMATDGALEPQAPGRRQDAPRALAAWQGLADDPELGPEAALHLQRPALAQLARWWVAADSPCGADRAVRDHLWVPPRDTPPAGHRRLWIVLSCVDSRHTYPQVNALVNGLPHDHLLFVNNPEFNWYGDAAFDSLRALVAQRVTPHFQPGQVVCYFGSMGGHGAMKLALQQGFRAIVFNPQTDLDVWAAFRPGERERLWGVARHRDLGEGLDAAAWGRAPTCVAVGSSTADREAFAAWVDRLRAVPEGRFIVEKYADPHHAALIKRICPGPVPVMLARTAARLDALARDDAPPAHAQAVVPGAEAAFWDALAAAARLKLEIWLHQGRIWHAPSQATGTRG